jgi:hypothetical protein
MPWLSASPLAGWLLPARNHSRWIGGRRLRRIRRVPPKLRLQLQNLALEALDHHLLRLDDLARLSERGARFGEFGSQGGIFVGERDLAIKISWFTSSSFLRAVNVYAWISTVTEHPNGRRRGGLGDWGAIVRTTSALIATCAR